MSNAHKWCNHFGEITDEQEVVEIGNCRFVADKKMIPLLKALNEIGLKTRTHNFDKESGEAFVSIVLEEKMQFDIRKVFELYSSRDEFDGETELLISWSVK